MGDGPPAVPAHVAKYFEPGALLGCGSFGAVYAATDRRTGARVAIKVEVGVWPQLAIEAEVLKEMRGTAGFPALHYLYDKGDGGTRAMVMERLGSDVETLRQRAPGGKLALGAVVSIMLQALERLAALHDRGIVHRDVKPDNLAFGAPDTPGAATLYLIDFGLAKRVEDPSTRTHIPHLAGKSLTGTVRFASVRVHDGHQQGRRDDLEALGYVAVFLATGTLPWLALEDHSGKRVAAAKRDTAPATLCAGLPSAFAFTVSYARSLDFAAMPDYELLGARWRAVAPL